MVCDVVKVAPTAGFLVEVVEDEGVRGLPEGGRLLVLTGGWEEESDDVNGCWAGEPMVLGSRIDYILKSVIGGRKNEKLTTQSVYK